MKHLFKIIFGILGIIFFIGFLLGGGLREINGTRTNCYDGYGNKIIGKSCVVANSFDSESKQTVATSLLGIFLITAFVCIGWILDTHMHARENLEKQKIQQKN